MKKLLLTTLVIFTLGACSSVDVTKTSKGYHEPTDPNEVEILMTKPNKPFEELGIINAAGFASSETAKMHNALRAKAAPLGADAIIVTSSGILEGSKQWVVGAAIAYTNKTDKK